MASVIAATPRHSDKLYWPKNVMNEIIHISVRRDLKTRRRAASGSNAGICEGRSDLSKTTCLATIGNRWRAHTIPTHTDAPPIHHQVAPSRAPDTPPTHRRHTTDTPLTHNKSSNLSAPATVSTLAQTPSTPYRVSSHARVYTVSSEMARLRRV